MTQREEFENKITAIDELFGITRNLKHDADTDNYFDAPTNSAYMWFKYGWQAAKAQAVPETNKDLIQSLRDMVEIVGANFCSNQDVKRKYKIARELLEQNK